MTSSLTSVGYPLSQADCGTAKQDSRLLGPSSGQDPASSAHLPCPPLNAVQWELGALPIAAGAWAWP